MQVDQKTKDAGEKKDCFLNFWNHDEYGAGYIDTIEYIADISSPQECQAACQQESLCHYWTLDTSNEECHLLGEDAPEDGMYDEEYVSGPKNCPVEPDCFYHQVVIPGYDVKIRLAATDPKECQKLCQAEPQCEYWSYTSLASYEGEECFLKNKESIQHGEYNEMAMTGPKNCPK